MNHNLKCDWQCCHDGDGGCENPATYALMSSITGNTKFRCDIHTFLADRIFIEMRIEEYLVKQIMES